MLNVLPCKCLMHDCALGIPLGHFLFGCKGKCRKYCFTVPHLRNQINGPILATTHTTSTAAMISTIAATPNEELSGSESKVTVLLSGDPESTGPVSASSSVEPSVPPVSYTHLTLPTTPYV